MVSFKSKVAQKVLNYFFFNESTELYVNEAARLLQEDPKNVYRMLVLFEAEGLLKSRFKGRERYFRANNVAPEYKNYKAIFLRSAANICLEPSIKIKSSSQFKIKNQI